MIRKLTVIFLILFGLLVSCKEEEISKPTSDKLSDIPIYKTSSDESILFLSTQMNPIEEANTMRNIILEGFHSEVDFRPNDNNYIFELIPFEMNMKPERPIVFGGLHGDFYTLYNEDMLESIDNLKSDTDFLDFIEDFINYSYLKTESMQYIPWMQATYIMVINRKALKYLPKGVDIFSLTYDELKEWSEILVKETGEYKLGFPAGDKGLMHRFFQGYLYPSFTGTNPLEFDSLESLDMWNYFHDLWKSTNQKSLFYMNMSDPLISETVWIAWDHTARLVEALKTAPDQFLAIPAPIGPKGRGYMTVLSGLGIPKGLKNSKKAIELIDFLTTNSAQIKTLEETGFFPVIDSKFDENLSDYMKNLLKAVNHQSSSVDSIPTLLPMGLRDRGGEFNSIYMETFVEIVLENGSKQEVINKNGNRIREILNNSKIEWW